MWWVVVAVPGFAAYLPVCVLCFLARSLTRLCLLPFPRPSPIAPVGQSPALLSRTVGGPGARVVVLNKLKCRHLVALDHGVDSPHKHRRADEADRTCTVDERKEIGDAAERKKVRSGELGYPTQHK